MANINCSLGAGQV